MALFSNTIQRSELIPGDHIYAWRMAYSYAHHGIYIGNNRVIHYIGGLEDVGIGYSNSGKCPDCGYHISKSGVVMSCLDCFLRGNAIRRYRYDFKNYKLQKGGTCTPAKSDPPEKVISRAMEALERGYAEYSLVNNNCEHFALFCKTGSNVAAVGQVADFVAVAIAAPIAVITGVIAFAVARNVAACSVAAASPEKETQEKNQEESDSE